MKKRRLIAMALIAMMSLTVCGGDTSSDPSSETNSENESKPVSSETVKKEPKEVTLYGERRI